MSLQNVFAPVKKEYDASAKPVVDVKMVCSEEERPRMVEIINRLAKSPRGLETLEVAKEGGFEFGFFHEETHCYGACDKAGWWVKLNPNAPDDKLVGTLSHECRHAGQFIRGAHETFGKQDVKSEIIMFRAMEADAQTNAVTACYELAQMGDVGPYQIFKRTYPEIEKAFSDALKANNGVVNHDVMTQAFKGWYDQNGTKKAYENGYEIEPMDKERKALLAGKEPTLLYKEPFDTATVVKMASYTDAGSYFTEDPKILESGKYLDVTEDTKAKMEEFFRIRQKMTGMEPDPTLAEIPTRPNVYRRPRYAVNDNAPQAKTVVADKVFSAAMMNKMRGR